MNTMFLSQLVIVGSKTEELIEVATYIMSWQLDNGGWTKDKPEIYTRLWNGTEDKARYYQQDGVTPLGTIDNGATVYELEILAKTYDQTRNPVIKESFIKGIEFLLTMQYESGGFPQVYPKQEAEVSLYENMVTYNDHAMINVMYLFRKIANKEVYYRDELVDKYLRNRVEDAYYRGIEYILASQIRVNGQPTVWGGQHDPHTYETVQGRSFEPKALISKESIEIINFLETVEPQTSSIIESVYAAKKWVKLVVVENTRYERYGIDGAYFIHSPGHLTWYRFYEIGTNKPLFGDRDGTVAYNILEISEERRHGYGWGGSWGKEIYYEELDESDVITREKRHNLYINIFIGLISGAMVLVIIRYKVLKKQKKTRSKR
jgi:PelA/Pel-15E family pectate lyase